MAILVDTDVFSFFVKDDSRKELYRRHLKDQFLFLSFMTYAELCGWKLNRGWGANLTSRLESSLKRYSIQYTNNLICEAWAEINFNSRKTGMTIAPSDAWIAATAISIDVPLISHNAKHFRHITGLNLISESN